MDRDILLIRYQVLAANRRHFSALFFAVVAFSLSFSLAIWLAMNLTQKIRPGMTMFVAGAIIIAGAFVARRLMLRERSSFEAMNEAWRALSQSEPLAAPPRFRPSAMSIIALGQAALGVGIVVAGAWCLHWTSAIN